MTLPIQKRDPRTVELDMFGKSWVIDLDENSEIDMIHYYEDNRLKMLELSMWSFEPEEGFALKDILEEAARDVPVVVKDYYADGRDYACKDERE